MWLIYEKLFVSVLFSSKFYQSTIAHWSIIRVEELARDAGTIKMQNTNKDPILSLYYTMMGAVIFVFLKCWPPWETSWKWHLPLIFGQIKSETISHRRQQCKKERERERGGRESSFESSQSIRKGMRILSLDSGSIVTGRSCSWLWSSRVP